MKKGKFLFVFTVCVYIIAGAIACGYMYTNGSPLLPNEDFTFDIGSIINPVSKPDDTQEAPPVSSLANESDSEEISSIEEINESSSDADTEPDNSFPEDVNSASSTTYPASSVEPTTSAQPEDSSSSETEESIPAIEAQEDYTFTHTFVAVHPEGNVNIRESNDTKSKVLGKLQPGSAGHVIAIEGDWCKIQYGDIVGYSVRSALKLTEIAP